MTDDTGAGEVERRSIQRGVAHIGDVGRPSAALAAMALALGLLASDEPIPVVRMDPKARTDACNDEAAARIREDRARRKAENFAKRQPKGQP